MRIPIAIVLVFALCGCRTAMTPGSAYRLTGSYLSLIAEPTFDIGAGPPEGDFYSFRVAHKNADGHSWFDVPIVAAEQLMFAPVWICSAGLRLTAGDLFLAQRGPVGGTDALNSAYWLVRKGLGWVFILPGTLFYIAGFVGAMAFDTVAHDAPVIVIGLPLRLLLSAARSLGS